MEQNRLSQFFDGDRGVRPEKKLELERSCSRRSTSFWASGKELGKHKWVANVTENQDDRDSLAMMSQILSLPLAAPYFWTFVRFVSFAMLRQLGV